MSMSPSSSSLSLLLNGSRRQPSTPASSLAQPPPTRRKTSTFSKRQRRNVWGGGTLLQRERAILFVWVGLTMAPFWVLWNHLATTNHNHPPPANLDIAHLLVSPPQPAPDDDDDDVTMGTRKELVSPPLRKQATTRRASVAHPRSVQRHPPHHQSIEANKPESRDDAATTTTTHLIASNNQKNQQQHFAGPNATQGAAGVAPEPPVVAPAQPQRHAVFLWPHHEETSARHLHIFRNGIFQSPALQWVNSPLLPNANVTWLVDLLEEQDAVQWIRQMLQKQKQKQQEGSVAPRRIVLVDYGDYPRSFLFYNQVVQLWREAYPDDRAERWVTLWLRSTATSAREWVETEQWVHVGDPLQSSRVGTDDVNRGVLVPPFSHAPYAVRTDTVHALQAFLHREHQLPLAAPMERVLARPVDVSHFWPVNATAVRNPDIAQLRLRVSRLLVDWSKQYDWTTFVGFTGDGDKKGRRARRGRVAVDDSYIRALTQTKIVVVTQRDDYEDHYRLMEALSASGACVFGDVMHGLPAGLVNGTSIVTFGSAMELHNLLHYYLQHDEQRVAVAQRGRWIAMTRHRSWHRMEELVFGKAVSHCRHEKEDPACPWTVHAS